MAIQYSVGLRNAKLDTIETYTGASPFMTLRTGAAPANCATSNSGTLIANIAMPSNWMNDASAGAKTLLGTWQDASADNGGTVAHFRIHTNAGTECVMQGSVTNTGGGGDMTLDNTVVNSGQSITISSFTITSGNA